ncbi:MAG: hypothetical protein ACK4RS_00215 [Thiothrix sp.]
MHFSPHQLVLYPAQATAGGSDLRQCLHRLGFIGAALGDGYYATGEQFLSLLCFLGCSPDIELDPHPSKPFCYVQLPPTTETVTFAFKHKPALHTTVWVVIGNIHEAEAVPDTALLDALAAVSGQRWKYAYRFAVLGSDVKG